MEKLKVYSLAMTRLACSLFLKTTFPFFLLICGWSKTLPAQTTMTDDGSIQNISYSGRFADFVVPATPAKDFICLTLRDGGKATVFSSSTGRGGDGADGDESGGGYSGGGGDSFVANFVVNNNKMAGGVTDSPDPGWAKYQFSNPISVTCISSITKSVDTENSAVISPDDVLDGSIDPDLSYAISQSEFDCSDISLSPITMTLTATDGNGATATCTTTVTINDAAASLSDMNDDASFHMINYNGTFQDLIIPSGTARNKLQLELNGGDGGKRSNPCNQTGRGGKGATIITQFNIGAGTDSIPPGSVVRFVVGEEGVSNSGSGIEGAGGGGGTAVLFRKFGECNWTILAVAGGGGGGYADGCLDKSNGQGGRTTISGGDGRAGGGYGGEDGHGGKRGTYLYIGLSAGGGGAFGDGSPIECIVDNNWGDGKKGGNTGGEGGKDGSGSCGSGRDGGFGFGGGGLGDGAGGGGGGYSGGGGGGTGGGGGGGGSYINDIKDALFSNILDGGGDTNSPEEGYAKYALLSSTQPVAKCKKNVTLSVTPVQGITLDDSTIDAGSYDPDGDSFTYSFSPASLDCSDVGVHTVTMTVTDVTNLTASCQTEVTVLYDLSNYIDLETDGDVNLLAYNGTYRDFIIPENVTFSQITFLAAGGDGGRRQVPGSAGTGCTAEGGKGAAIAATFAIGCGPDQIPPGSLIRFVVGEHGDNHTGYGIEGAGGGGGTGILFRAQNNCQWEPLIIAGGGGGAYASGACQTSDGKPAEAGASGSGGKGNNSGSGGHNGNGGNNGVNFAGGGGGASGDGENISCSTGSNWGGGKKGNFEGGAGGADGSTSCGGGRDGGYGYGGGGLGDASGGGGGGASGGGAGGTSGGGGGGGSFIHPMKISNMIDVGGSTRNPDDGVAGYQFLNNTNNAIDQAPTANCQDITVELDANAMACVFPEDISNGSSDACGTSYLTYKFSNGDYARTYACAGAGDNIVTLVVTDLVGQTSTCTATITVEEMIAPTASCQDVTVELDLSGNGSLAASEVDNGSTDNCGITSRTLSKTAFTISDLGVQTVSLLVSDASGNTDNCNADVTVELTFTIDARCRNVAVSLDAAGNASVTASEIDNGSSASLGIASLTLDQYNFTCPDVGNNTVIITVTDNFSNTATCSATVTVNDNVQPFASCQSLVVELDNQGQGSITPAEVNSNSSDACGIQGMTLNRENFNCSDLGQNTVTLTVIDNHENTNTCTSRITVYRTITLFDVLANSFCIGDEDATVRLSDSEPTVHYQLRRIGSGDVGAPLPGTGDLLDFGMQPAGFYTVIATSDLCGNTTIMNGPAEVRVSNCDIVIPDHCSCNSFDGRTATTLKVQALPGQNWKVKSVIGLYDINSPQAPAAPTPLTVDTPLNYIGGNMYTLAVLRLNDKGYWVQLTNGDTDLDIQVGNASW